MTDIDALKAEQTDLLLRLERLQSQIDRAHVKRDSERVMQIIAAVARAWGVLQREVRSQARRREVAQARQAAMLLLRQLGYSLPEIGRIMRRHHATVLHGVRSAQGRAAHDAEYALRLAQAEREVRT